MTTERSVPETHVAVRASWKRRLRLWSGLHYSLGLLAALGAAIAGVEPSSLGLAKGTLAWIGALSGVVVAAATFLAPSSKAQKYLTALNILRNASRRYQYEEGFSPKDLNDAVQAGERIIQGDSAGP